LEIELRELKAFTPRNREELNDHMGKVRRAYDKYGVDLKAKGNSWSKYVGNRFTDNLRVAGQDLKNKINWDNIGASIAAKLIGGSFGMRPREFAQWIVNGKVPKGGISGVTTGGAAGTRGRNQIARHTGGAVFDGRSGIPRSAGKYPSEVDIRAKVGEWVMPTNSVRKYGPDFMHSVQKGDYDPNAMGGPGAAMLMGAMSAGITQAAINAAIQTAAARAMMLGSDMIAGKPGKYGDTTFNAEQLQNASTIMSVGSQLGASSRDLVIALMTAMQESMLRNINYGHLDSLGLFQQRSAWGSAADRTNPAKATRMFFKGGKAGQPGLFDIKGRNKMSLSAAAQAVQRSAFPNAYAKWENEARAILASSKNAPGGGTGPSAGKGWNMPLPRGSYRKSMGFLGYPGHYGADYAAPSGTPIYAVKGGTVTVAKDLTTSYGKHVGISHPDGWYSLYAHMSRRRVGDGAKVRQGQRIGDVGTTGNSTGNHLHLETRMGGRRGRAYDPSGLIPGLRKGGQIRYDNTLANLHKNETVLTAPLTEKFKDGVSNLDSGGAVEYNVTVD